jgi:AmpD protein
MLSDSSRKGLTIKSGWLTKVEKMPSPHFSPRNLGDDVSLLVIHNISLPAGQFTGNYISDLFLGCLDCKADKSFADLVGVRVSAHCLIRRNGSIIQYVSFNDKAWHAGVSSFDGREQCNDFSIGIELEGTDTTDYTPDQYKQLINLTRCLQDEFPAIIAANIAGHCHIAPGRKTDPGQAFDWLYFRNAIQELSLKSSS